MLPHYSAFKVAESFRMLETLYPGRVDLGLGRAPGGDPRTAAALAYLERSGLRATVGDPTSVRWELEAIAENYGADHLGIVTICFDFEVRRRSYALLAEACLA